MLKDKLRTILQSQTFYFLLEGLFFLYLFWYLFSPHYFMEGLDMVNQYLPYKDFLFSSLEEGIYPAWNPYIFAGRPFYGDSQIGIFYPFNYLLMIDLAWGFSLITMIHFLLAFTGMFFFLRALKLTFSAVHFGAFIFTFSSFFVSHLLPGIMLFILAGAWTGWILWSLNRLFFLRSVRYSFLLTFFVYLTLQAGAPQIALYSLTVAGFYLLFLLWETKKYRAFLDALCFFIFGILLSVISLLPVFHFTAISFERAQGIAWEYAVDCSWLPRYFILSIFPFFYAFPAEKAIYWGGTEGYWEITAYWGIPTLVLLGAAVGAYKWYGKYTRLFGFACVLFLLSMIMALGENSPLFYLVYRFIPVFSDFRVPGRYIFPATVALSIIVSLYVDRLSHMKVRLPGKNFFIVCASLAGIGFYLIYIYPLLVTILFPAPEIPSRMAELLFQIGRTDILLRVLIFIFSFSLLAIVRVPAKKYLVIPLLFFLLVVDLGNFGKRMVPVNEKEKLEEFYYRQSEEIQYLEKNAETGRILATDDVYAWYLRDHLPEVYPNRLMMHRLRDARGYDPLNLKYYVEFMNILGGFPPHHFPGAFLEIRNIDRPELLPLLNVDFLLSTQSLEVDSYELAKQSPRLLMYQSQREEDFYLRFYPNWQTYDNEEAIQEIFLQEQEPDFFTQTAIIEDSDPSFSEENTGSEYEAFSVDYIRQNESRISGTIEAPQDGVLMLSESYHPSWILKLNGEKQQTVRTNYAFNGFYIPEGNHEFEVVFLPIDQQVAFILFAIFLVFFAGTTLGKFIYLRKKSFRGPIGANTSE